MGIRVVLANPLSWAIVGCGLAVASTFLVWDVVPVWGLRIPLAGYDYWYGKLIAGSFLAVGLALLATYQPGRPAAWQTPAVGLAGATLLAFGVWYQGDGGHRRATETDKTTDHVSGETREVVRTVTLAPGGGLYAVQGVGVGLLVVSAMMVYRRRTRTPNQARHLTGGA